MTDKQDTVRPGLAQDMSEREKLQAKLVLETARLPWTELQRFYARGQVVNVAPELDLIAVAVAVAEDDKRQVEPWLAQGLFGEVKPAQAQAWFDRQVSLWTVVVAPWVLVQTGGPESGPGDRPVILDNVNL